MRRIGILALLLVGLFGGPAAAQEGVRGEVLVGVRPEGVLHVRERWTLPSYREFTRVVYLEAWPGAFPLRQRLTDLEVLDGAGSPLTCRRMDYGLDQVALRVSTAEEVRISYLLHGAAALSEGAWRVDRTFRFYDLGLPLEDLSAALDLEGWEEGRLEAFTWSPDFSENLFGGPVREGDLLVQRARGLGPKPTLRFDARVGPEPSPAPSVLPEYGRQMFVPLVFLLVGGLAGLALRFASPGVVVTWVRLVNGAYVLALAALVAPLARFDILAPHYEGLEWVLNAVSAAVVYLGLVGMVGTYAWIQDRLLSAARPEAWYLEFGLPAVLLLLLPAGPVEPAFWVLPLAALTVLIPWSHGRLSLYLGASSHLLAETVTTEGEVSLDDLARRHGLSRGRLVKILRHQPSLPMLVDYQAGVAYSPATASLRADLAVCPRCGGATAVKGQQVLACPYCGGEYSTSRGEKALRPVPAVVEAHALIPASLGAWVWAWTAILSVVGFLDEAVHVGLGSALGYTALLVLIGAGTGWGLLAWAGALREGKGYGVLRWTTGLLTPRALGSRRVQLHFGRLGVDFLAGELKKRGELSLADLADLLDCSGAEAGEVARFLVSQGRLEAVYDRVGSRLVLRRLYGELAGEGACPSCGGILGILGGRVACHYCDWSPSEGKGG